MKGASRGVKVSNTAERSYIVRMIAVAGGDSGAEDAEDRTWVSNTPERGGQWEWSKSTQPELEHAVVAARSLYAESRRTQRIARSDGTQRITRSEEYEDREASTQETYQILGVEGRRSHEDRG